MDIIEWDIEWDIGWDIEWDIEASKQEFNRWTMDMGVSGVYGVPPVYRYLDLNVKIMMNHWRFAYPGFKRADVEPEVTKKKTMARLPSVA